MEAACYTGLSSLWTRGQVQIPNCMELCFHGVSPCMHVCAVCMCEYVCMCACVYVYLSVYCRGMGKCLQARSQSCVSLNLCHLFSSHGVSLNLKLIRLDRWARKPEGSSCLSPHLWYCRCRSFYMAVIGGLNLVLIVHSTHFTNLA